MYVSGGTSGFQQSLLFEVKKGWTYYMIEPTGPTSKVSTMMSTCTPRLSETSLFAKEVHLTYALFTYLNGSLVDTILSWEEGMSAEVVSDHRKKLLMVSSWAELISWVCYGCVV